MQAKVVALLEALPVLQGGSNPALPPLPAYANGRTVPPVFTSQPRVSIELLSLSPRPLLIATPCLPV